MLHPRRWSGHYLALKIPTTFWGETGRNGKGDVWKRIANTPAQVSVCPLVQHSCDPVSQNCALPGSAGGFLLRGYSSAKLILINYKVRCSNLSYGGCRWFSVVLALNILIEIRIDLPVLIATLCFQTDPSPNFLPSLLFSFPSLKLCLLLAS